MSVVPISPLERTRREQGLSQAELAERAGVTRETVSRVERGRPLSLATAFALARALGVDSFELFERGTDA